MSHLSLSILIPKSQSFLETISDRSAQIRSSFPSTERIQKIGLKVIGGLSVGLGAAGVVSMAIGIVAFPLGMGIVLSSFTVIAISFLFYRSVIDYTDLETIKSLRISSVNGNWAALIYAHGLPNLLKYEIITPSKCRQIFQEKLNSLSFLEASSLYDEFVESIKTHCPSKERFLAAIPKKDLIDWSFKWKNEVNGLSACEINDRYKIFLLRNTQVFDIAELFFLQQINQSFQSAKSDHQRRIDEVKEDFLFQIRPHQEALQRAQAEIDAIYFAILDPQRMSVIQGEYDREAAAISAEKNRVIGRIRHRIERIKAALREPNKALDCELLLQENRLQRDQLIQVECIAQETTLQAWNIFIRQRQRFAQEIAGADAQRISQYKAAYSQFASSIVAATEQRDQRLTLINDDFIRVRNFINDEYKSFL